MNQNFLDTIYLFSCGANGRMPDESFTFDFNEVYNISKSQGIWETVFLSIISLYERNPDIIKKEIYEKLHQQFIIYCSMQYMRYDFIHKLIKKFDDSGIENCILKGESIARFYHTPVARISSDVDILVNPQKVDLCLQIMKENGFDVGDKVYDSHQIECLHPKFGLVEIHTMMYGRRTEDVCFNNEIKYEEEYLSVTAEDGSTYKTLGITDNFLFLLLHFIKHFLSSGVGIRQLVDVLMYVKNNYELIDWQRASRSVSNLGFEKIFNCIIAIGKKYFLFPENIMSDTDIDETLVNKIFEDMMQGGVFGHDDDERHGFYDLYLNERYKKLKNKNYETYKNMRKLTRLFPNRDFMALNYPYVNKTKLLLPVAWIHRIIKGIIPKRKQETNQISQKHSERLKLLRDLDMI